jgi:proline dehydrogenase
MNRALVATLPLLPRSLVHLVARNYVAGSRLEDAVACVQRLNAEGSRATIDVLGEFISRLDEAARTRDAYMAVLRAIRERRLDSTVSIKLTALGLKLDPAACRAHVAAICEEARAQRTFVRLDMEDSSCTQATLDLFEDLHRSFDNVGPVLQASLRRTAADARKLARPGVSVRLCKGIYVEPPAVAWRDREIIRRNYAHVLETLLRGGAHVGVATHDEMLVFEMLRLKDLLSLENSRFEFQMLLGVEVELRRLLTSRGHEMRVYVPFGERWYEYSIRRLKENPEIAGHVARATFKRLLPA